MKKVLLLFIPLVLGLIACESQEPDNQQQREESNVRERGDFYMEAMNSRDADTLAEMWSEEAVYRNPLTGDLIQGREGIKAQFIEIFDRLEDVKATMVVRTIKFPVDGKAVEEGVVIIQAPGEKEIESPFRIVYIKEGGEWLITHVSELDLSTLAKKDSVP